MQASRRQTHASSPQPSPPPPLPPPAVAGPTSSPDDNVFGPPCMYDPGSFGISFLWRWQGTILPLVAASPLFWFLLVGHAVVLTSYHQLQGVEPVLEWQAAIVPSSLLTFLLVTFGNQCRKHQSCARLSRAALLLSQCSPSAKASHAPTQQPRSFLTLLAHTASCTYAWALCVRLLFLQIRATLNSTPTALGCTAA